MAARPRGNLAQVVAIVADIRVGSDGRRRCGWVGIDPQYERYHDEEWGYALHGDRELFEKLSLEAFQAGLSWITILRRRDAFRVAFADFTPQVVARFDEHDVERLMHDPGIIRNRAKILATISNALLTQRLVENEPGALDRLIWSYARDSAEEQRESRPTSLAELPSQTTESAALSGALRTLGYRFVGPTTSYALMQSCGLVNDHLSLCWRTEAASALTKSSSSPAVTPGSSRMP
ncbi:MAG: DNA-3-methyladenine glycosylase I [Salinibacterium sp.]|nr:DNA-3-methyladenine glycosylase I [Salinibacterium sp.]